MTEILEVPVLQRMEERRFAGPVKRYNMQSRNDIPAQWMAYNASDQRVMGASVQEFYGVVFNYDAATGSFDYLCGQEVPLTAHIPDGFGTVTINGPYARFATSGPMSTMQAAWGEIYDVWLKQSEFKVRAGASVEYYPPEFDGDTGEGGYEIWMPVDG